MFLRSSLLAAVVAIALLTGCRHRKAPDPSLRDQRIEIQEFELHANVLSHPEPVEGYAMEIAEKTAEALRQRGLNATAVPRDVSPQQRAPIMVQADITAIDGGDRMARYLGNRVGGAARLAVRGVVRRADGRSIGEFSDVRCAGYGFFGGDTVALMHDCVNAVAEDIAHMISTGEYRRRGDYCSPASSEEVRSIYSGPQLAPDQVAVMAIATGPVRVRELEKEGTSNKFYFYEASPPTAVAILPGKYTLTVWYDTRQLPPSPGGFKNANPSQIQCDLQPGARYLVVADISVPPTPDLSRDPAADGRIMEATIQLRCERQ